MMGSKSRKSTRIVEVVVILCVAVTAALAGWRMVEGKTALHVSTASRASTGDCREAERYCSLQCRGQLDECVETCMTEFACVSHL